MIIEVSEKQELPWELLLLADPDKKMIEKYIYESQVFIYQENKMTLGVVVIKRQDNGYYEIMNTAVSKDAQGRGIGKIVLNDMLKLIGASENKGMKVRVKTGETSTPALNLYKSCGFHVTEIVKDYFLKHYDEPIYEEGQLLKDQIILEKLV
ncbi:GNAT family N-acetyltransferase [Vagococcus intermedius]|nr:N-acetyltransferase [Vagococcus intermedius]WEG76181.1 GNAT family N-acetyltransferase [Vagococcus intermedius]